MVGLRLLESALLTAMGAFMALFAWSEGYWQLLNPKYAWLTGTAGGLVVVVGLAGFLQRQRKPRLSEISALVLFLGLAMAALTGPNPFAPAAENGPYEAADSASPSASLFKGGSLTLEYDDQAVIVPSETLDGTTFTRLNLAELLAAEEEGWPEPGEGFAVQGMLLRTPELDAAGYVAVGRLLIFCCFADAVGVTTAIKVDRPEDYMPGTWVKVLGILREGAPLPDHPLSVTGAFSAVRSERYSLEAVRIDKAPMQGIPFIMEIKKTPPFAY